jgi:hypothetical protein
VKVQTAEGLIEREALDVVDRIQEGEDARVTCTEWRHQGRLVRRDVHVNVLRGMDLRPQVNA